MRKANLIVFIMEKNSFDKMKDLRKNVILMVSVNEKPQNVLKLTEKKTKPLIENPRNTSPVSKKKAKSFDNKIRKLKTTPNFTSYHHQKTASPQSWPLQNI